MVNDPWDPFTAAKWVAETEPPPDMRHAFLDTTCEACGKHVGALIINGPDPAFIEVQCPHCAATWWERVS